MCLPLKAKADAEVETGPIIIRRRYDPYKREAVLEMVRKRHYTEVSFWLCICGHRMHADIVLCSECGRHRHHLHTLPVVPKPEQDKTDKAYEALKKELDELSKDVKDALKHSKSKEPEPTKPPPPPKCTPVLPSVPFIPLVPGAYFPEQPRLEPKPSPKPDPPPPPPPVQQPPVVIVNVPECSERKSDRPRRNSQSSSASSLVSSHSFQRVKEHVRGLGRRVWGLEDREYMRQEEHRRRQEMEERRRIAEAEDRARQRGIDMERHDRAQREQRRDRERERELEVERRDLERREDRERARERSFWRRRDCVDVEPVRVVPMPFPVVERRQQGHWDWHGRGWPYVERWEGERRGVLD